ncbi:hypothetical protein T439DRAFT_344911 [Meredithblackwellia eburnea MCA 4105]
MDVDTPMEAPVVPAQEQQQVELGLRAKNATEILEAAAERVIQSLTEKKFGQSFPDYQEQYPELMKALKARVEQIYRIGIKEAIKISMAKFEFVEKANELDRILKEARERKERGEKPGEWYLKGADATITIPSTTVPLLRAASAELRERRLALEKKNRATYDEIARNQQACERTEAQIREILDEFKKSITILESVDPSTANELQRRLVEALPGGP